MKNKAKVNGQGLTFPQWQEIVLGRKPVANDTHGTIYTILYTAWESNESSSEWYLKFKSNLKNT